MRPIGPTSSGWTSAARHAAVGPRLLEKACNASGLGTGSRDDTPPWEPAGPQIQDKMDAPASAAHVPFRHAQRLTSAFVAQLLGQVLPDHERKLVATPYEDEPQGVALLCDRRF